MANSSLLSSYIGRFAPSPSGPLHMGSLVAALGSYLQAKQQKGQWLVRIEDIDPPREQPGADKLILETLISHGLHWDGEVIYQSERSTIYDKIINTLLQQNEAYYCGCTRKQIKQMGGYYQGLCQDQQRQADGCAIRIKNRVACHQFIDLLQGPVRVEPAMAEEDFIILRRDQLYAYNLAVVIDDIEQGITQIVRGADLITPTARQISLYNILKQLNLHPLLQVNSITLPSFMHLPLVLDKHGNKLSKQNHAPALKKCDAQKNLVQALQLLKQCPPATLNSASITTIIDWGIHHWQPQKLHNQHQG